MAKRPTKPAQASPKPAALAPPAPLHEPAKPLSQILGQDRAIAALTAAAGSGRLHHAWMFHGPKGVGKFTTALAFAAVALDPTCGDSLSGEWSPDPDSPVQTLIRAGLHPDLHVVRKELARFDDDSKVREKKLITIPKEVIEDHLLRPAALAPTLRNNALAGKVFIVDEAELLDRSPTNAPVQNALLKTIEEPADRTLIILVTSSEESLLPTIRSRCQRVAFSPLDDSAMQAWMKRSGLDADASKREWILRFASGAPGVAKLALECGLHEWHVKLAPMLAKVEQGEFVVPLGATLASLIDSWAAAWVDSHDNASKDSANKEGCDWMIRLLGEHLRAGLRRHAAGDRAEGYARAIDLLREFEARIDANLNIALACEGLSADLSGVFEPASAR